MRLATWQRIITERCAAKMRRQAADISERVDLDPQQFQARAIGRDLKGYARQTQEAGGVGSGDETVDEGRFDLVEVRLRRDRIGRAVRLVRRLPLDRGALGMRVIVSRPVWRMDVVMMMVIVHVVRVVMIMSMFMHIVMMTVVVMTHGGPQ